MLLLSHTRKVLGDIHLKHLLNVWIQIMYDTNKQFENKVKDLTWHEELILRQQSEAVHSGVSRWEYLDRQTSRKLIRTSAILSRDKITEIAEESATNTASLVANGWREVERRWRRVGDDCFLRSFRSMLAGKKQVGVGRAQLNSLLIVALRKLQQDGISEYIEDASVQSKHNSSHRDIPLHLVHYSTRIPIPFKTSVEGIIRMPSLPHVQTLEEKVAGIFSSADADDDGFHNYEENCDLVRAVGGEPCVSRLAYTHVLKKLGARKPECGMDKDTLTRLYKGSYRAGQAAPNVHHHYKLLFGG